MNNRWMRNSFVYLLIIVAVLTIFFTFFQAPSGSDNKPLSEVIQLVKGNQVREIAVNDNILSVTGIDGQTYRSRKESGTSIFRILDESGADYTAVKDRGPGDQRPWQPVRRPHKLPATRLLWGHNSVYDAPGPGQQQPDHELR